MSKGIESLAALGSQAYNALRPESQRALAVSAALELVSLNVQGANSSGTLEAELKSLSNYADLIQDALKVK